MHVKVFKLKKAWINLKLKDCLYEKCEGTIFIPPFEAVYVRSKRGWKTGRDNSYPAFKEKIRPGNSRLENQNKKIRPFTKSAR